MVRYTWRAVRVGLVFCLAACASEPDTSGGASGTGVVPMAGASASTGGAAAVGGGGASASVGGSGTGGSGGSAGTGGIVGSGGALATGGTGGTGGMSSGGGGSGGQAGAAAPLDHFSFFVTSLAGLQRLSGSPKGFGGDLTYGQADGLSGADKICEDLAETSMKGSAAKQWRAFLSVVQGPGGGQVDAIDRIGDGPWYDRLGRVVAMNKPALLNTRPMGADIAIANDLPNEDGVPNHAPDGKTVDNHHVLTGSNDQGRLYGMTSTCESWTSSAPTSGRPRIGFSWPDGNRQNWISGQDEGGCGPGVLLDGMGGSDPSNPIVGSGGGYGAIYCFALAP